MKGWYINNDIVCVIFLGISVEIVKAKLNLKIYQRLLKSMSKYSWHCLCLDYKGTRNGFMKMLEIFLGSFSIWFLRESGINKEIKLNSYKDPYQKMLKKY